MTFLELGLSPPTLKAIDELGYCIPTPVQQQVIPAALKGQDIVASAPTGTGKTASFALPILDLLNHEHKRRAKRIQALILVPTRELAIQIDNDLTLYSKHHNITSMAMFGGVDLEPQKQQLIDGIDILVSTTGRLLDMIHQRALHFDELKILVLDEADRMLDMGFIGDINKVLKRLPTQRQNLLFSATLSDDVHDLTDTALSNPFEVNIKTVGTNQPQTSQWLTSVDKDNKSTLLSHLIKENNWAQALIFIRTKHGAAKLVSQLEKRGIAAEAIHSGKSQAVRTQILADFKAGKIHILVGTGITARGLDVDGLERVINYDLPDDADDYIHRIGRTGRANAYGEAVSLVSFDDFKRLCAIERRLNQVIERKKIKGFETKKELPESNLNYAMKQTGPKARPKPNKKSKKTSEEHTKQKPKTNNQDPWGYFNKP